MTDHGPTSARGTPPGRPGLLLPVLPPARGPLDPVAIATWHLALSDAVRGDLPHELLALWLFPDAGGVVLLGPAALAADHLELERPEAFLSQEQLLLLEERVRRAGYASVVAAPVRDQDRDLGLMLLAALAAGQYGPIQAMRLFDLLRQLVVPFRDLARLAPGDAEGLDLAPSDDREAFLARIAKVAMEARTGTDFVTRLSAALHAAVPHDDLLVLVRTTEDGAWEWLGAEGSRRRWRPAPGGAGSPQALGVLAERLATRPVVSVADLAAPREPLAWPTPPERRGPALRIRAMLAASLRSGGTPVGCLLLGSAAPDLYRPADEARLAAAADLIGPAVAALTLREEATILQRTVAALEGPGGALARVVRRLATVAHFGEATRAVADTLRELTGATSCRFILRLGSAEAVAVVPGEVRPLLDLPLAQTDGAAYAPVLRGHVPLLLRAAGDTEELFLPLRVAGRPFGVLALSGPHDGRLAAMTLAAQQVADAIAPHLELVRREAGAEARSDR